MCNCNLVYRANYLICCFAAVIAILLLAACGGSSYEDYFPSEEGTNYTYRVIMMPAIPGVENVRIISRTEGKEVINGNSYWKDIAIWDGLPGLEPDVTLWRVDDKGRWDVDDKDPAQSEHLSFPFDAKDGTSWTVSTTESELQNVLSVPEQVILPDKTYDECIKVSGTGTLNGEFAESVEYRCKSIGIVKATANIGGIQFEMTLESISSQ